MSDELRPLVDTSAIGGSIVFLAIVMVFCTTALCITIALS